MTPYRRRPRPMAVAVERVRAQWEPDSLLAEVQRVWAAAVGPAIAGEAQPSTELGGVVTVSCSASVWAQELDLMGPEILESLNRRLHSGRVSRLRCVTIPPRS